VESVIVDGRVVIEERQIKTNCGRVAPAKLPILCDISLMTMMRPGFNANGPALHAGGRSARVEGLISNQPLISRTHRAGARCPSHSRFGRSKRRTARDHDRRTIEPIERRKARCTLAVDRLRVREDRIVSTNPPGA